MSIELHINFGSGWPQTELLKNQQGSIPKNLRGKKCYPNLYFLEIFGNVFETSIEILLSVLKQAAQR
jgi:hypothetical protein